MVIDSIEHGESQGIEIQEVPEVPRLCDSFDGEKQRVNIGDCSLYTEISSHFTSWWSWWYPS